MKQVVAVGLMALLTAGCQSAKAPPRPVPIVVNSPEPAKTPPAIEVREAPQETGAMAQCQHELTALQQVAPDAGQRLKGQFDQLLRSAALYNQVRTSVNGDTRGTVDALFTFKSGEVCAQIRQALVDKLIRRVEGGRQV
ncbi:hypothetical protein [Serratia proteamaculans]|uniref:Lipoprotein n=1 Tax=Serratia proteamaculans TaxID=28151 RepID=A0A5Q2V8Y0_SERPR|nr:hypothetical protein [Serratia proteamaculans]QGH60609.1 hypothetical protein GHV41_07030 [Serratia proteamaculans]